MIASQIPLKIKGFWYIDRCSEGSAQVVPKDGEEFIGIPYGYLSENSYPFIEVYKNGVLYRTINTLDVSQIEFMEVKK